jgi:hypothetical protein
MRSHAPPKAGALLFAGILVLLAAAPAAAAPDRAPAEEPSLFEVFTAWLAARLPGAPGHGLARQGRRSRTGRVALVPGTGIRSFSL